MDLRSELEQHARTIQGRVDSQLQEIHQIQETVLTLNDRVSALQSEIDRLNESLAPQLRELAAKKELMAQWQSALAEHENSLLANQMLIAIQTDIEKNHATIERKLAKLEIEKASISESITQFHRDHPYISADVGDRLNRELLEKQSALEDVMQQMVKVESIQTNLNFIVKLFLDLLHSMGWRTDPLADEQKKLVGISEEIIQITNNLKEYSTKQHELDSLRGQDEQLSTEKKQLIDDEAALQQIDATKRAISESKQTIKQLQLQIKNTGSDCAALQKQISNTKLDKKLSEQRELVQEKEAKIALVKDKSEQLADIDSPKRAALKTGLKNALLQMATHQERTIQDQEVFRSTHTNPQFFRPTTETRDVPHFIALSQFQTAIKLFQKGLEPSSKEWGLLSQITTKLILWQMAENNTNAKLSMQDRNSAHQELNTDIAALITALPIDNPLHATQHYIETMTLPLEKEEHVSTKRIRSK